MKPHNLMLIALFLMLIGGVQLGFGLGLVSYTTVEAGAGYPYGQLQYLALPLHYVREPMPEVFIVDGAGSYWPIARMGRECWTLGGIYDDGIGPVGVFTRPYEDAACADLRDRAPFPGELEAK